MLKFLNYLQKPSLHDWRALCPPLILAFIMGSSLSMSFPLLSIIMERAGVSASLNGANTAIGGVSALLIAPFIARIVLKWGLVPISICAILVSIISLVCFMLTIPSWLWLFFRFFIGICTGFLFVMSEFWINALVHDEKRGLMIGLHGTILSVGLVSGPLLLLLTGTEGVAPFLVSISLFSLCLIPIYLVGHHAPQIDQKPNKKFIAFFLAAPLATLAGFLFGAIESATHALLPVFATRQGYEKSEAILMVAATTAGGALMQAPLGALSDTVDRRLILFGCGFFSTICLISLIFFVLPLWAYYLVWALFGGSICGIYTIGLVHLSGCFRGADQMSANAAFVMLHSFGMLIGPVVTGVAMDIDHSYGFLYSLLFHCIIFSFVAGTSYFRNRSVIFPALLQKFLRFMKKTR